MESADKRNEMTAENKENTVYAWKSIERNFLIQPPS